MFKSELIDLIAAQAEISKATAAKALNAMIDSVVATVAKGDTVVLPGFGTFKSTKRAARTGRHPQTGEALKIAASTVPRFTAGSTFKKALATPKKKKKSS
ncbi:HU family DNA-binding protein [Nitrosomonas communis]|uniref:DNA-binding protein HU-beta n=1 Tax=Nitrosomonas communis TaxID=44574 RepID=A0A1I4NDM5_9PROT|nr:HU family DNA-binding protein [Nitrosomonas communis]SFM13313.1 DNA-binding protein HU-beta [Nitrosomonas communis]